MPWIQSGQLNVVWKTSGTACARDAWDQASIATKQMAQLNEMANALMHASGCKYLVGAATSATDRPAPNRTKLIKECP